MKEHTLIRVSRDENFSELNKRAHPFIRHIRVPNDIPEIGISRFKHCGKENCCSFIMLNDEVGEKKQ